MFRLPGFLSRCFTGLAAVRARLQARLRPPARAPERQFAALCWREDQGAPEVLLITSRDSGRWIVPKGWPMKGRAPHESAATEAWEEAGVTGRILPAPLGSYGYAKHRSKKADLDCRVDVFSLEVSALADDFPEKDQRRRKWFPPEKAALKVAEPELRALILGFAAKAGRTTAREAARLSAPPPQRTG